jgi:hypothetical protein
VEQWYVDFCRLCQSNSYFRVRYHYWCSTTHDWTRTPLLSPKVLSYVTNVTAIPVVIGKRGKLFPHYASNGIQLLAILPSNAPNSTSLSVLASTAAGHFRNWTLVYEMADGCDFEPLIDPTRGDDVLSLYLTHQGKVGVVDLDLSEL